MFTPTVVNMHTHMHTYHTHTKESKNELKKKHFTLADPGAASRNQSGSEELIPDVAK